MGIDKTNKKEVEYEKRYLEKLSNEDKIIQRKILQKENIKLNSRIGFEEEYECWRCGNKIKYYDEPNERVFCHECRLQHQKEYSLLLKEQQQIKAKIMLENAICMIENSNGYAHEYKKSYDKIKLQLEKNSTIYKSSNEVVVGMVLDNYNYNFIPNYKLGKYIIDFYISELEICLEVDGERHNNRTIYDKKRDIEIRKKLGATWEIVRIPTYYIENNPEKIIDAIVELKKEMQNSRRQNGIIEDNFSKREQDYYGSVLKHKEMIENNKQYETIKKFFENKKSS